METVNKKELIAATLITVLIAFMDISGLPASLFLNINIADITSYYFTVMVNFVLIALVCFLLVRAFCPGWEFGLQTGNIASGLKKYGLPGIAATLLSLVAFWYGLYATSSFDYSPTIIKVLIEGFVYYIGVAFIEELYVRGLLQNIIEKSLGGKKSAALMAVIISAVIFGLGHIPGTLDSSPMVIISKVIWTIGLGIYLGAVYVKTRNLWVPIILHMIIDFCGVPFCFLSEFFYPELSLFIVIPVYLLLGGYGLYILHRD